MVQIAMLLFAFPFGASRWRRRTAYLATGAVFIVMLIPQTISQRHDEPHLSVAYWVVQVITAVLAVALLTWGERWGSRRRAMSPA